MPKKILIADDDEIDRMVLERWCIKESYSYSICMNGKEAYECLKKEHFDLLISDLDMPVMGGLDLIQKIKNNHLQVPCIAVSANEDEKVKQKALELGFDGFISKMLSYKDLSNQISYVVNHQHLLDK